MAPWRTPGKAGRRTALRRAALAFGATAIILAGASCKPADNSGPFLPPLNTGEPTTEIRQGCSKERPCWVWKKTRDGGWKLEQKTK